MPQVRELDAAQSRLRLVVDRVETALDLTSTLAHARTLFERREWEALAQCTFRVLHQPRAAAAAQREGTSGVHGGNGLSGVSGLGYVSDEAIIASTGRASDLFFHHV